MPVFVLLCFYNRKFPVLFEHCFGQCPKSEVYLVFLPSELDLLTPIHGFVVLATFICWQRRGATGWDIWFHIEIGDWKEGSFILIAVNCITLNCEVWHMSTTWNAGGYLTSAHHSGSDLIWRHRHTSKSSLTSSVQFTSRCIGLRLVLRAYF
jgi:hypothetical protein